MTRPLRYLLLACLPLTVRGGEAPVSFAHEVMPHLIAAGCSAGSCHAKPEGQNNFGLSVFGYDLRRDYFEIVRENRGRRIFPAAPEESLLLRKATGAVPHEGGKVIDERSDTYRILSSWIRQGAPFEVPGEPALESVVVASGLGLWEKGEARQVTVTARFSDGSERDVTELSDFVSHDTGMVTVAERGLLAVGEMSGEAVVVVRYMGHVDVVRVTVPSENPLPEEVFADLPVGNEIDRLAYQRHRELGLLPSATCTDGEFIRRASLDLIGRLPSAREAEQFIQDPDPAKRGKLVDSLLDDPNYADHWAVRWGDLIRPNPSRVGVKPVYLLDDWIRDAFRKNLPYDVMVRELLTAEGSSHRDGPVAVFRDKREPADASAFVSQIFLGVRLDCAKCHQHPNEKWTQADYYQLAAFFARMKRKGQGISAPISGEPEYWWHGGSGNVKHPVSEEVLTPKPPDGPEMPYVEGTDPREQLAEWMTDRDNPFFARAIVNRIWSHFMGRGLVEPVDDLRVSNPPTNEPLLDWLADDFAGYGYDLKRLMRTIVNSNLYQLSSTPNESNLADGKFYSRFLKRRIGAEVLLDAVSDLTGQPESFQGMPAGSRAVQTWNHKLDSDFLDAFGRPDASQECPCERELKPSVVQALHLMNSSALQRKLGHKEGRAAQLAESDLAVAELVREIYLATYSRLPEADEAAAAEKYFETEGISRQTAVEDLLWALINSAEFVFNH
jgi:hypothetical protein